MDARIHSNTSCIMNFTAVWTGKCKHLFLLVLREGREDEAGSIAVGPGEGEGRMT